MWEQHPNLILGDSTLTPNAGVGLFAKEAIPENTLICWFWGHMVLATCEEITNPQNYALHSGLDKNLLMFPDDPYNPIVYPPTDRAEDEDDERMHLFLITSNCCYGRYVQPNALEKCNARIVDIPPPMWESTEGYRDLAHFQSVMSTPIMCLQSTRVLEPGEEIFANYGSYDSIPNYYGSATESSVSGTER